MERAKWSSSFIFILAAIGSAIGIGNIWRFPYIFGQHGGAAFLIPYFVCVLVIGFPLMLLETTAGRKYNASIVEIFRQLKLPKVIAWFPVILGFLILSYYIVITSWTFLFSGLFLMNLPTDFSVIENTFLIVPFFLAVLLMLFLVEKRGIKNGVENAVKYLMPVLLVSLVLLVIFSLSQENAISNTSQYFAETFNLNAIWDLEIWLFAASQVLFSLFVGYGIMLTYGSYLQKDAKIIPITAIVIFADVAVSLLAILLIVPLALSQGINPGQGFDLAFVTIPTIFTALPFGFIFGALFFIMLFAAAFTSVLAMIEVPMSSVVESFNISRKKASKILISLLALCALPALLSYSPIKLELFSTPILDLMDLFFGSMLSPLSAIIVTITLAWLWKKDDFISELGIQKSVLSNALIFILKFAVPILLGVIFIAGSII